MLCPNWGFRSRGLIEPSTFGGMRLMHFFTRSIAECTTKRAMNLQGIRAMAGTGPRDRGSCAATVVAWPPPRQDNTLRQATDLVDAIVGQWPAEAPSEL